MERGNSAKSAIKYARYVNALLFAVAAGCLFLPFFSMTLFGEGYFHTAIDIALKRRLALMLFIVPALGLIASVILPLVRQPETPLIPLVLHGVGLAVLCAAGPLILEYGSKYYRLTIGGWLSVSVFIAGAVLNAALLFKEKRSRAVPQ